MIVGEWSKQGLANGWASLGYTNDWRKPPSEEEQYKIRRARMVKHMQQCGKLKTICSLCSLRIQTQFCLDLSVTCLMGPEHIKSPVDES